jgi:hypothetical protein
VLVNGVDATALVREVTGLDEGAVVKGSHVRDALAAAQREVGGKDKGR